MITFDQYVFYSYAAGIVSAAALIARAAYVWLDRSDQNILKKYRLPATSLNDNEYPHYLSLQQQLDDTLEALCKVPVTFALPPKMSKNLTDTEKFDFVICEKKSGRIRFVAEVPENSTPEKQALCKIAGLRYTFTEVTSPEGIDSPSIHTEFHADSPTVSLTALSEETPDQLNLNLSAVRDQGQTGHRRTKPLSFGKNRTQTDDRTGFVQRI